MRIIVAMFRSVWSIVAFGPRQYQSILRAFRSIGCVCKDDGSASTLVQYGSVRGCKVAGNLSAMQCGVGVAKAPML